MQTQNARLAKYLKRHGKIDPMTALDRLGVFRLAARVKDLRDAGYQIDREMVVVRNRFGESCRVAQYKLQQESTA